MNKSLHLAARSLIPAIALAMMPGAALAEPASAPAAAAATATDPAGPPLWKVADEDTTIYLFPTVHFLTAETQWFDARIASALGSADELVTELPAKVLEDPASQQYIMKVGLLPADKSLRAMLTNDQRTRYEAGLAKMGLPAEAFDRFEPWFASLTLSVLPLMQRGYKPDMGVEKVLESKTPATVRRDAVETFEGQMALFDELPEASQIEFLMQTIDQGDKIVPTLDAMVAAWSNGDPDKLAAIMNENMTDATLAERLLYARNRAWAEWIDTRLDKPGVIFMAVGGGHLAGKQSVQEALEKRGIKSTRLQ